MNVPPNFRVGTVPVFGDVILAPMAGYADVPHRHLCRSFGSAMSYSEFVAVEDIINRSRTAWARLDFVEEDRPMVIQLFGNDARQFLEAAMIVQDLEPDVIDINMGCSTRRVSGRGAGVGMMPQLKLVEETFGLLASRLSVPVTGKIRLGWEGNENYLEIGRVMEANGASLIAIHPRTKEQKYDGHASWQAIARLRESVQVPVIGSGDVCTPDQIDRMLADTGCDAVMIGRGAVGNPWIFGRIDKRTLTLSEIVRTMRAHLMHMVEYHGMVGVKLFRKYLKRYLDQEEMEKEPLGRMLRTEQLDELLEMLEQMTSDSLDILGMTSAVH